MDIQQNNVAVLHFNLVNQDGSTIFIRKTKLATFNLINPSEVSVPITDIGFDATLNQCWVRVPKESNAATGQYYGVLNIVDDDWGTYTTSKIKVYSVVSDADEDTKSVVFTATCLATQITNPSGGNSPYYNTTTSTWWQYSDTLKAFEDTGVGNLIKYITKNVQHLKDGTGNGSIVTCLDDEISANNIATGLCSTDFGKNNYNEGESCVALGENNYIAKGVSNATAIAGARPSIVDVFAVGDKTAGNKNVFEINKFGDISLRPDSSQERTAILQDILDHVIKNAVYDSSNYSLTVTFYSAADNANKTKTYDLSGLKAVLKDDAVKEISVNQATAVMTVDTINGSSKQIQLPTTSFYVKSFVRTFQAASPVCFDAVTDQDGTKKTLFSPALFMKEPQTSLVLDNVYTGNSGGQTEYFKWFYDQYQITENTSSAINTFFNLPIDFATKPDCTPFDSSHVIVPTLSCMNGALANYLPLTGNAATATKLATARSITLSGNTKGTATFDGSDNITIATSTYYAMSASLDAGGNDIVSTYATKAELNNHASIQPFDFLDSNEQGTFWTQTNTNSIAVVFMTDSKVVTNKVRIFIGSTASAKIRCAIYKKVSSVLSLVTQTQLFTGNRANFLDIPFETVATLESDMLYFFAFECSSKDSVFLGKQINASLLTGFVLKGDAFNANSDTFKSQYPTDGVVTGNIFIPYFKII